MAESNDLAGVYIYRYLRKFDSLPILETLPKISINENSPQTSITGMRGIVFSQDTSLKHRRNLQML